ncbi:unnamed protein product [Arabis nemorensis]|uniref:Uncharacterized protein n=1 Tax=Arabis nemorensis TaxID=586526 RepID=A0A565AUI7_9BRAS|nr:unnamed protein product [Arabis nemorensis]
MVMISRSAGSIFVCLPYIFIILSGGELSPLGSLLLDLVWLWGVVMRWSEVICCEGLKIFQFMVKLGA